MFSDFPCMDINLERCPRLQILGQCATNPVVAFMCAKSCAKCVSSANTCIDTYAACASVKQYCSIRAIQLQCARTCDACGVGDQEGTNTGSPQLVSSKSCKKRRIFKSVAFFRPSIYSFVFFGMAIITLVRRHKLTRKLYKLLSSVLHIFKLWISLDVLNGEN